jgi:hypothetical protein
MSQRASVLLAGLRAVGVELRSEGDRLRWRPAGKVSPAMREMIAQHKGELLALLQAEGVGATQLPPGEKHSPHSPDSPEEHDLSTLIAWFQTAQLPTEPFDLFPWRHVVNPARFYQALRDDISIGPHGARARTGALQEDLARLRQLFCQQEQRATG